MKTNRWIAGLFSFIIPGLGQIYQGRGNKGALILTAAIVIGNLNLIILPLISMANPVVPPDVGDLRRLWAYWIPRIGHDVLALWSIAFWIWVIMDALHYSEKSK